MSAKGGRRRGGVVSASHDGVGRRVSLTFSDGRVLKFDKDGVPIGDPEMMIEDADTWDDSAQVWVGDWGGTQVLTCTLGDLRRMLRALYAKNRVEAR